MKKNVVRLICNESYPTYQLLAEMNSTTLSPEEGLRFGALTTMQWVSERLDNNLIPEFDNAKPEDFGDENNPVLKNYHFNNGFVIDIIYIKEDGLWAFQLTEPDLGGKPGEKVQQREAVPGRIIVTNIAFYISENKLHCAFQTVVSDPIGTEKPADVYRLAIIKRLADNKDFGLKHFSKIDGLCTRIDSNKQYSRFLSIINSEKNFMPSIVFTCVKGEKKSEKIETSEKKKKADKYDDVVSVSPVPISKRADYTKITVGQITKADNPLLRLDRNKDSFDIPEEFIEKFSKKDEGEYIEPPYDIDEFSTHTKGYCRVYLLDESFLRQFEKDLSLKIPEGDVLFIEPKIFGRKIHFERFSLSAEKRAETRKNLQLRYQNYLRHKTISFDPVLFIHEAHNRELELRSEYLAKSMESSVENQRVITLLNDDWSRQIQKVNDENRQFEKKLGQCREREEELIAQKEELQRNAEAEKDELRKETQRRDEKIEFLVRKVNQPKAHEKINEWVEENFEGRLFMHQKAIDLLKKSSAKEISIELICDALDFLATDYYDYKFNGLSEDEMLKNCSDKYNRPFTIMPVSTDTINFSPTEYKIKYNIGFKGKPVDTPLNQHLKVGNKSEFLLRIYFYIDEDNKLLVIGSLPNHLTNISGN